MTKLHFAFVQSARYDEGTGELIDSEVRREYPVETIAQIVGDAALKYGRPEEIVEYVEERNGYPCSTFVFPATKNGAQTYIWVEGLSAETLRELYRAANPRPVRKSERGCSRCGGTGIYVWGGTVNGRPMYSGVCFRCLGSGDETRPGAKTAPAEEEEVPKRKRTTGKTRPTIDRATLAALVASGQLTADQASLYMPRR